MPDDLRVVYERGRSRVGEGRWPQLSAHEQSVAVYQELRALDAGRGGEPGGEPTTQEPMIAPATIDPIVVRLRLTGHMQAWTVSGENTLPHGRKTRALLAVVAMSSPKPVLRSRLAELLWSRRPDEQARASLRQEIQLLLRALAPARTEVLRISRDHVSLMPGVTWIDVEEIMRGGTNRSAALSLLDGDLLEDLDGVDPAFDLWLTTERERLRDRARSMAETLLREQTDPSSVIAAAHRVLQIDRTHEEAWRSLMRAHADQGERGMAIQTYERCRAVLADLLDTAPSDETQTLLREVRGPSSKRLPARPPRSDATPKDRTAGIEASGEAPVRSVARPRGGIRVGVLPLRGVGLAEDTLYLGPSLANEITSALSRFRWLTIISPSSVPRPGRDKGEAQPPRRDIDVDFLMDGAIQRSRNNIRVTLRLLDLREDNQVVWARRFDRCFDDPLAMQDDISGAVAAQASRVVLAIEGKRHLTQPINESSPYDLCLTAVPLMMRMERSGFMRAREHLTRAIAIDPEFDRPHLWFAIWHVLLLCQGWAQDPLAAGSRAVELAERAVVLDPLSAGSFTTGACVRTVVRRNPREALALCEHSLKLNPNLAVGWAQSALIHICLGQFEDAERCYQRYQVLSPLDPYSFLYDGQFAALHLLRGDHQGAVAVGRSVTQLNPHCASGYAPYLSALGYLGETQEAGTVLRRLRLIDPAVTAERCLVAFPVVRDEDRDRFLGGLHRAGLN